MHHAAQEEATLADWVRAARPRGLRSSRRRVLSAPQWLVLSFAGLIAAGTAGFLALPGLVVGESLGVVDALFTATSAICVTGLSVFDVSSRLTRAGQFWLLLLIQLGGLGILVFAALTAAALGRRASLDVEEAAGANTPVDVETDPATVFRGVVRTTLAIEAAGALALWALWAPTLGATGALWPAFFHAISAFCNAGFSTFHDNLVPFAHHAPTLGVIGGLIVLGGIGFVVLDELRGRMAGSRRRISTHTRLALITSTVLIAGSMPFFWWFERGRTLGAMDPLAQLANVFFLAVTPRTAGFNTVDYGALENSSILLTLALMWIGGSPASTAGGVKTTTVALLFLVLWSRLRGQRQVSVGGRSLPDETIERATGLAVGAFLLLGSFTFLLLMTELSDPAKGADRSQMTQLFFEAQSALGTVGLSMGITSQLTSPGRVLLVVLMFLGRVGPLAVLGAMARRSSRRANWRYAHEDVLVG